MLLGRTAERVDHVRTVLVDGDLAVHHRGNGLKFKGHAGGLAQMRGLGFGLVVDELLVVRVLGHITFGDVVHAGQGQKARMLFGGLFDHRSVADLASSARRCMAFVESVGRFGVQETVHSPSLDWMGNMVENGRMPFT